MEHIKIVYDSKTGKETAVKMTKEEIAELKAMQEEAEQENLKNEIAVRERELLALLDRERLDEALGVNESVKGTVSKKDDLVAEITSARTALGVEK